MALIVQKYGGTSVGTVEKIKNVAKRVARSRDEGNDVVVVVSAMAGGTNPLLGPWHQTPHNHQRGQLNSPIHGGKG